MGSVTTRRRRRLRRYAKASAVLAVLRLFIKIDEFGRDLLTRFGEDQTLRRHIQHRELLPLPAPSLRVRDLFGDRWPSECYNMLSYLIVSSAKALNYMYMGKMTTLIVRNNTSAQNSVYTSLTMRWLQLAEHLSKEGCQCSYDPLAYQRVVDKGKGGRSVRLRADKVDSLEVCAAVDPMQCIESKYHSHLADPSTLVTEVSILPSHATFTGGSRAEYVKLVRAQCRSGKVELATSCLHAAPVFAVGKRDGERQRVVWDGSALSSATIKPPHPPLLANSEDLNILECSDDRPLCMSMRDGQSFFDQLHLPRQLRSLFGMPAVTTLELSSQQSGDDGGLTDIELRNSLAAGHFVDTATTEFVVPRACCWPMGCSWASYIAQSVMVASLRKAGATSPQFIHAKGRLPSANHESVSVATDDVVVFERLEAGEPFQRTKCPLLHRLDCCWEEMGIRPKDEKSIDRTLNGSVLGRDLVNGRFLLPKRSRLLDVLSGLLFIFTGGKTTPTEFNHFFGIVQWIILAVRPMLSCCSDVYQFVRKCSHDAESVPRPVQRELFLIFSLLPSLVQDLRHTWDPHIYATDGAQIYGYGGASASCDIDLVRDLASASRLDDVAFLLTGIEAAGESRVVRVPFSADDFNVEFSVKSKAGGHACALEIGAFAILMQKLARNKRRHKQRMFSIVDSLALKFALEKGRSSAPEFRFTSRRIAALLLAGEIQLYVGYTPSRSNPSDAPSRGVIPLRPQRNPEQSKRQPLKFEAYINELKRSIRRCIRCDSALSEWQLPSWTSSCSASTITQPSRL